MKKFATDHLLRKVSIPAGKSGELKFGPVHFGSVIVSLYSGSLSSAGTGTELMFVSPGAVLNTVAGLSAGSNSSAGTENNSSPAGGLRRQRNETGNNIPEGTAIDPSQFKIEIFNHKNEKVAEGLGIANYEYAQTAVPNRFTEAALDNAAPGMGSTVGSWSCRVTNLSASFMNAEVMFQYQGNREISPVRIELEKRNKALNDFLSDGGEGLLDITIEQKKYYLLYNNGETSVSESKPENAAEFSPPASGTTRWYKTFIMPKLFISASLEAQYPEIKEMIRQVNDRFKIMPASSFYFSTSGQNNIVTLKPRTVKLTVINGNLGVLLKMRAAEECSIHLNFDGFFKANFKRVDKLGFDLAIEVSTEEPGRLLYPRLEPVLNYNTRNTEAHVDISGIIDIDVTWLLGMMISVLKDIVKDVLEFNLNSPEAHAAFFRKLFADPANPFAPPAAVIAGDTTLEGFEEIEFIDMNVAKPPRALQT